MKITFKSFVDFLKRADLVLFGLCMAASVFGIVIISSAAASIGTRYVYVQSAGLLLGIGAYFVFTLIDIDVFADRWPALVLIEVGLLLLLIPFGTEINGNTGWIGLGVISFQPTEFVKLIYLVLCAKHISYLKEFRNINSVMSVLQAAAHFGFLFVLILMISSDLGSALVYFFIFIVMMFAAGVKFYWFLFGAAGMAVVIPLAWNNFLSDRHKERILAPYVSSIDPDNTGVNWQPSLAKSAISSGRLTGAGLFNGTKTQSHYLTSQHADYIYASAGEELGFIGCLAILFLLLLIIIRCIHVGLHSRSSFGMLLCFGVAASLTFQTFINIGMSIGLTPVIGITLPFFSYGGSSILTTFAAVGLVSGVHARPKPELFMGYNY